MWKEFKEFAFKGNVLDMSIGVIIGGAFGKIVTSLVNDIIMPFFGFLTAGTDFKSQEARYLHRGAVAAQRSTGICGSQPSMEQR